MDRSEPCRTRSPIRADWNRQRRDIALISYAMLYEVPYVYSPYIDHEVCEFLLSLPVDIIESGTFHDEAIRENFPQYAHIPFEDKSIPNPKAEEHWSQFVKDFSVYYFKRLAFRSKSDCMLTRFSMDRGALSHRFRMTNGSLKH